MEFADITLLECNRQQSIQAKSNNNEQPAIFTCKTGNGIKLETGDTVEIVNAFVSEDGCGGANMEFDGEFIYTDNGYDESGNKEKVVSVDLEYTNIKVVKKTTVVSFQNKQSVEILNVDDNTKYENSSQKILLKDNETTVPQRYYKTNNGEGCMFQPRRFALSTTQLNKLNPPKKSGGADTVLDPQKQYPMYSYFERTDDTDTGRSFADPDLANVKRIPNCDYYYMVYGGNNNYFEPAEKEGETAQRKSLIYKPRTNNKRFTMFMRTRSYYDYDAAPDVKYYADGTTDINFLLNDTLRLDFIAGNDYVPYIELKDYKVEKGFYSPTNVAAQITEQMQQNIDYEDIDGNTQPQPETYTKTITFANGDTEVHNLFSTTTTNSYFPIEVGATGRDDEDVWNDILTVNSKDETYAPSETEKTSMEYYHSTLQYIFVKRPELFTLGRKINDSFGRIQTNTTATLDDVQAFVRQDIFSVNADPQPCITSFEWNITNLNNISNFLKAQNEYANELELGLDRYLHIMAYKNVVNFGDDGYVQAAAINNIQQSSYPLYFKYQQELENIENDGLQGTDNLCFGFATKTQIGDNYFITIHPEITQSRVSGYIDEIFINQDTDGAGNGVIKATTGNNLGTFIGYDYHATAFATLIMTARNGISNGPPDSLFDKNASPVSPENQSVNVNSVCDYAVVQQDPPVSKYNTNCQRITEFLNFRYIGANNPALVYNQLTNSFGFQNLHTAENVGQSAFAGRTTTNIIPKTADTPEQTVPTSVAISAQASTECYKINKRLRYSDYTPDMKPYWVSYPQHLIYVSGQPPENLPANMTLTENSHSDPVNKMIYLKQDEAPTDLSIANPNIEEGAVFDAHCGIFLDVGATCPERYWKKSFWGLLGFSYEQFNPKNITIENGEQIRVGEDTMFSMKFATTNCQVVSTDLKDYPINQFGGINYSTQIAFPLAVQYNSYTKGTNTYATSEAFGLQYTPEIVQNTQSITTRGQDIPKLMINPYFTIRTDLLDQEKYVGGSHGGINMKIMGLVNKINGVSDYFFTDGGGMAFTITNPITITDITTAICEPNGRFAKVNENSAVIYKITKSKNTSQFNIVQQILQEQIAKKK